MNILCVDDEALLLQRLVSCVQSVVPDANIRFTQRTSEALVLVEDQTFDIAFLDINMRGMTGVELAEMIKRYQPRINIIFVTAYSEYKPQAMDMHASGYIMKPVTKQKVMEEMDVLRFKLDNKPAASEAERQPSEWMTKEEGKAEDSRTQIRVQCFGNFDVFDAKGNHIAFARTRSKELLAYLIFRQGARCTTREIASILFEDQEYDTKVQDLCRHIISSLISGLRNVGAGDVVVKQNREIAIDRSVVDCDFYRFLEGDEDIQKTYSGEFMQQYSWAESENAHLERLIDAMDGWM